MPLYKRRSSGGKKQQRCIEMLEALGIQVTYCHSNQGYWRMPQQDVYRWEWGGRLNGIPVTGGCWETMTECAKPGRHLEWNRKEDEVWPVETNKGSKVR